jgi:predicted TIM-barrel fold metal-dependent hydrolase
MSDRGQQRAMLIIDSHVHTGENWSEPVEVLLHQMDSNGVAHAVLVGHNGNYDNTYLLDCVRRYQGRFKAVGLVDAQDPDRLRILESLREQGASGIRINLRKEQEWDPDSSLLKAAGRLGMIVSVIGDAANFGSARFWKLLDNCPDTHFCLEHLVRSPGSDVTQPPYTGYREALECARWPNTTVKVPGLGEILRKPGRLPTGYPWNTVPPHYEMAKAAFGVQRMMWGSNFPPCAAKEGYRNALNGVRNMPLFQNGDDAEWVMGKTAAKLWGFSV